MRAFIINRLREPSTWAALAAVAGIALPPGAAEGIGQVIVAVVGLAGVLLPERKAA